MILDLLVEMMLQHVLGYYFMIDIIGFLPFLRSSQVSFNVFGFRCVKNVDICMPHFFFHPLIEFTMFGKINRDYA